MTLLFVLVQVWHSQSAPEEKRQERERQLEGVTLIMNIQARKMLDQPTRLDSVTYKDGIMRISYTLTKFSKSEVDSEAFTKETKAIAASVSCTEEGLGSFVKSGLLVHYTFNDASHSPISDFQISNADCI